MERRNEFEDNESKLIWLDFVSDEVYKYFEDCEGGGKLTKCRTTRAIYSLVRFLAYYNDDFVVAERVGAESFYAITPRVAQFICESPDLKSFKQRIKTSSGAVNNTLLIVPGFGQASFLAIKTVLENNDY